MTAKAIYKKAYEALERIEKMTDKNLVRFIKLADAIALDQLFQIEEKSRDKSLWPLNDVLPNYEGLLGIAYLLFRDVSETGGSNPNEYYRQVKKIVGDGLGELDGLKDDYGLK